MTPRIDAHQHFWRFDPARYRWIGAHMPQLRQDYLPEHLAPLLAAHGLDGSIAVQARADSEETDELLALAANSPWIRAVVGWADLRSPGLASQLQRWSTNPLLRGFRHQVQDEPSPSAWLEDAAANRGVALLQAHGYVYELLVHARDLAAAADFCRRHAAHWLVLDHLGKPDLGHESPDQWRRRIAPLAELPHVACKLSGLVTEADWQGWSTAQLRPYLEIALELFGPHRLLLASDWPVCLLAADYAQVIELQRSLLDELSTDERAAISGGTACRLYEFGETR
ncbi:amidohydrolase 2 [Pseudomonas sp. ATCC 13867]|uniref:amidohydrolase family protein n=1 Tax=Pseudomonas sp. ATCC 13867 TaxID=1294143 RepID=UPI0002C4E29A|nr:amidohydrolase family protein [Pseudomonas sp. ATCC 13867]AGI22678.1 amidohydrolase 2 [Pseudomonas sp. ATCC 13867]RFQ20999.1 amidohydrolase [Pseudomonas sp. ATCC 13867]